MIPIITLAGFNIYTYPLIVGLAWGVGYNFTRYLLVKQNITTKGLFRFFLIILFVSFLGAKVTYYLFAPVEISERYLFSYTFWFGGGFVFYGGLIFGLGFCLINAAIFKQFPYGHYSYLIPSICFSHGIGRLGCFLAGCCYGKETQFQFSFLYHGKNRHPVQIYEAIVLFTLGFLFLKLIKRNISTIDAITLYLGSYALFRFMLEFLRGDSMRGLLFYNLSTSQSISILILAGSLTVFGMRKLFL